MNTFAKKESIMKEIEDIINITTKIIKTSRENNE